MRLHALLVMVVGLICAATTEALELRWSNGQQDLQHVNSGWRELVVSLGPAQQVLPGEWSLFWSADSDGVAIAMEDSVADIASDTARVIRLRGPLSAQDQLAHRAVAEFRSGGTWEGSVACYRVWLPAEIHARFRLQWRCSSEVGGDAWCYSADATSNGGCEWAVPEDFLAGIAGRQVARLDAAFPNVVRPGAANALRVRGQALGAALELSLRGADGAIGARRVLAQDHTTLDVEFDVPASA